MKQLVMAVAMGWTVFAGATPRLDISDVSFLLPLPYFEQKDTFRIPLSQMGKQGVLFSKSNFKRLPKIGMVIEDLDRAYENAHVMAVRIDPCFPQVDEGADPKKCAVSVIRMVGQVLEVDGKKVEAMDLGMHLIYAFKLDEEFVNRLVALKEKAKAIGFETNGVPLGVHPVLRGDYWKNKEALAWAAEMKAFLLEFAGEKAQIAASFMVTHVKDGKAEWEWTRVPFNPATKQVLTKGDPGYEEALTATKITNVEGDHQSHVFAAKLGDRKGTVIGRSTQVPALEELLVNELPDPTKTKAAYDAAYQIENPKLLTIPSSDCVSCHVATSYRLAGESRWMGHESANAFKPAAGITAKMEKEIEELMTTRLYAVLNFGYLFTKPSVSQRTVNESAEVVRFLNQNFPAK